MSQDNLGKLLEYLITPFTPASSRAVVIGLVGAAILFVAGLAIPLGRHALRKPPWLKAGVAWVAPFAPVARVAGGLWLILFFLRFEGVVPFTMRLWVYSLLVIVAVWTIRIILGLRREQPVRQAIDFLERHYTQYLPQRETGPAARRGIDEAKDKPYE